MSFLLIDGAPPSVDDLSRQALVNYGAYTSLRVEQGAARGLDRHLARLDAAAVTLFGEPVGEDRLRDLMRTAVSAQDACWLRVSLFSPEIAARAPSWRGVPRVMTLTAPSPTPLAVSVRLQTQVHTRYLPQVKHAAQFDLIHARRTARDAGFDDALFIDTDSLISEGSSWNLGFVVGDTVTWPQAPMLAGVTQALIADGLASVGMRSQVRPIRLSDLDAFTGAFLCNSATPACTITAVNAHVFAADEPIIARLSQAWTANAPQPI